MASLWDKINNDTGIAGFTPPLVLRGVYTLAGFATDVADLRAAYQSLAAAERELKLAREDRDKLLEAAYERMKQYRARIEAEFEETDPLFQSLPDLTPAPGHTPNEVVASGFFNEATGFGEINWIPSTDPDLQEYEIRMTPGPTYDSSNASVVGTESPGVLTHSTIEGLGNPGDEATFKVYVVLTTGNEAGSNPVTITRP